MANRRRWLFIIEGSITVAIALVVMCFLPGLPDRSLKSSWLFRSEVEKDIIMQRSIACTLHQTVSYWDFADTHQVATPPASASAHANF